MLVNPIQFQLRSTRYLLICIYHIHFLLLFVYRVDKTKSQTTAARKKTRNAFVTQVNLPELKKEKQANLNFLITFEIHHFKQNHLDDKNALASHCWNNPHRLCHLYRWPCTTHAQSLPCLLHSAAQHLPLYCATLISDYAHLFKFKSIRHPGWRITYPVHHLSSYCANLSEHII